MNIPTTPHRRISVFAATIARHVITVPTHAMIGRLRMQAARNGVDVYEGLEETGGIALARNLLAETFLDRTPYDYFLSLDDDVGGLTGDDLARMIAHELDVVGAPLPGRAVQPDALKRHLDSGALAQALEQPDHFLRYKHLHEMLSPIILKGLDGGITRWITTPGGPVCEVAGTSAGCLLISRKAIERMVEKYGRGTYNSRKPPRLFDFTETMPDDSYSFCARWRELGGKVYVDGRTRLTHRGVIDFSTKPLVELEGVTDVR